MPTHSTLRAGAAAIDITPPLGTHLSGSGWGERRPAESILDPLYAKAIVFEEASGPSGGGGAPGGGGKRLAIVALDLILITDEYCALVRRGAAARFGLPPEAVMVHCTQTHSAPSFGHCMLDADFPLDLPPEQDYVRGAEPAYCRWAAERAVQAIGQAVANLRPVTIGYGRAERHDLAYNRRQEQTIDPEVGVVAIRDAANDQLVSLLLHYSCHPVNVFCKGAVHKDKAAWHAVTADWCGAWAEAMREACGGASGGGGARCTPIVINGSCGNVNPGPYQPMWDCDHVRQGRELARTALEVLSTIEGGEAASGLDYRLGTIGLDYRQVPRERLEAVERILAKHPQPVWTGPVPGESIDPDWFQAASTRSIEHARRRSPQFQYEIQAFRIGELAIVGLPGEPFAEGQLELKRRSPARGTIVAHMVSHYVGYLPTREKAGVPGHETNVQCTYWAKLAPGSLERIVDAAADMLADLFDARDRRPHV